MASNRFGQIFAITTWGESHGPAVGVVIDGCPAGLALSEQDIQQELAKRAPGQSGYTTPRKEPDCVQILSGVFAGQTTGTPISILIPNQDADSSKYEPIKHLLRPGHANFTYLEKYGVFDYRGGGRSSARETACRVAAGAVARKMLSHYGVEVYAYLKSMGEIQADVSVELARQAYQSPVRCPDQAAQVLMQQRIEDAKLAGDSLGGVVEFVALNLPVGFGDPIYEKLEANLAKAMMSMPASKGFEIGEGFGATTLMGSEHNDEFVQRASRVSTRTNHAGGTLGGISTGMPLLGRVAFKPTSSIKKTQQTVDLAGEQQEFQLPSGSRHDPCVAIRAVPVVEAMCTLVLADALLMNRSAKL